MTGLLVGGWPGARLIASAAAMSLGVGLYLWAAMQVLKRVREAPRLALPEAAVRRWVDFYSSADPVPNGPMQTWPNTAEDQPEPPPAVHPTARLLYNLRSVQADHSYYPDNTDEFVSQLASELAAAGGLAAKPTTLADPLAAEELAAAGERTGGQRPLVDPEQLLHARARRRWRTSCRSNARNLLLVSGLLGAVAITLRLGGGPAGTAWAPTLGWARPHAGQRPRPAHLVGAGVAGQTPPARRLRRSGSPLQHLAGVLLAAAVVIVSALLLGRLWSVWDSNDIDRFFLQHTHRHKLGTWRTHWPSWAFLALTGLAGAGHHGRGGRLHQPLLARDRRPGRRPAVHHPAGLGAVEDLPRPDRRTRSEPSAPTPSWTE